MRKVKAIITILIVSQLITTGIAIEEERQHKIEINVSSQADQDYRNYPVKLEIPGEELDSQTSYDIDETCDTFGSNIDFINTQENRSYNFWVQNGSCNEDFTVWVDLPFLAEESKQEEDLTFYLYTGEEMSNTNSRREVFSFFEDFETYSIGRPISNYRNWNIEVLSGREEEFGEADINLEDQLSMESNNGKTTITHPIGIQKNDKISLEINSTLEGDGGSTIGFTDGRVNRQGEKVSGYSSLANETQLTMSKKAETDFGSTESVTSTETSKSLSPDENYIQTIHWDHDSIRSSIDDLDYEELSINDNSQYDYQERTFLQISANQDTELKINWVRLRQQASEEPEINQGNGVTETDIKDVKTETPTITETKPEGTIGDFNKVNLTVEADYPHYSDSNLTVIFKSPDFGVLGYDKLASDSDTANTIWNDLRDGEDYEWYPQICDRHLNCIEDPETNSEIFDIDHSEPASDLDENEVEREDLFMGLRDEDFQPQGFYSEESETIPEVNPDEITYRSLPHLESNWIVMARSLSNQLEPGMSTNTFGLQSSLSNPERFHRFHEDIEKPSELGDSTGPYPLWFDTITTADRSNQYALAPERNWAVDTTGTPYPTVDAHGEDQGAFVRTEIIRDAPEGLGYSRSELVRESWNQESVPKYTRAMSNSIALTASDAVNENSEGWEDTSGQLIEGPIEDANIDEGMGFWMDPDDIRTYHPDYNESYDSQYDQPIYQEDIMQILQNSPVLDITGPSAGIGYHLPEETTSDRDFLIFDSTIPIVLGDIYWEGEYRSDEEDPRNNPEIEEELNPYMCGDDSKEYLLEELGEVNNSRPEHEFSPSRDSKFACVSHNEACVSWDAADNNDGKKVFSIGEYVDTRGPDEQIGKSKNSQELCMRYDFEYPRFSDADIETDILPAWYPQDLSPEVCRENTLFGETEAIRWINKTQIEEQPYAFKGGINNDLNPYLYETKELEDEIDFYNYDENMISNNPDNLDLDLDPGDSIPISTGRPEDPDAYDFDGHNAVTAGFCGGDDDGEYFKYQDCHADFCPTSTDTLGVADSPEKCLLETDYDMFENEVAGFEGFDNYKGEDQGSTGNDQRRQYEQGESVTIETTAGEEPITCFGGTWYEDDQWPLLDDIEDQTINLGETLGIQFEILNPTENVEEFEISYNAGSDISPFTEFLSTDETEYTIEVEPETIETETMVVEGERTIDSTDDNQIELQVESTSLEEQDSTEFDVEVVEQEEAVGAERTGATELPGPSTPLTILAMIITSMFYIFRKQDQ